MATNCHEMQHFLGQAGLLKTGRKDGTMYWQHLAKRLQLTRKACMPQVQLILILLNSFFKYEMIVYVWSVAEFLSNRWRPSM